LPQLVRSLVAFGIKCSTSPNGSDRLRAKQLGPDSGVWVPLSRKPATIHQRQARLETIPMLDVIGDFFGLPNGRECRGADQLAANLAQRILNLLIVKRPGNLHPHSCVIAAE